MTDSRGITVEEPGTENLREEIDERGEEILDHVEKASPRPSVDADIAERLLTGAPPAHAAAELAKMVEGFHRGAGAATGRRNEPVDGTPPTEDLNGSSPAGGREATPRRQVLHHRG